jgi:D-alanyl-D-alanine carboxypeptidase
MSTVSVLEKPAPTTGSAGVAAERLQMLLEQLGSRTHVHHAILAVETGDGDFRWSGAVGEAHPDGTPASAEMPFFYASITKMYIAAAVLILQERGGIRLDRPITFYLPKALVGELHRLHGINYTELITVRHLLSHASGLPEYLDVRKDGRDLAERLLEGGDFSWTVDELLRDVREAGRPHFPPQSLEAVKPKIRYSDTNYQLLIAIIEAVTRWPFHRVLREMIFEPNGLCQTWVAGHDPLESVPAPAATWLGDRMLDFPLALRSIGDLYGTAPDALRFMRKLVRGDVFDDPNTVRMMQHPWNRFSLPLDLTSIRAPGWPIQYGLGLMRFQLPRLFAPFRPVPPVIGHTGSTGSWLFYCPEYDLYFTGTVDQSAGAAVPFQKVVPGVLRALGEELR